MFSTCLARLLQALSQPSKHAAIAHVLAPSPAHSCAQEPVLTFGLYNEFLQLTEAPGDISADAKFDMYQKVVRRLPERNFAVVKCLMTFLAEVAKHEEANKYGQHRAVCCYVYFVSLMLC